MTDVYAIHPGGDVIKYDIEKEILFIGGRFVNGLGEPENITTWNGNNWGEPNWAKLDKRYHIFNICAYCGQKVTVGVDACLSCGAPTADWWVHLDQMLADWRQEMRGLT